MPLSAPDLVRLIESSRFDLSTEKHLQEDVASALREAGIQFVREKALSARDIPDFMVGGVAIECKMRNKSRKMAIFQQLSRYAEHADVECIILASNLVMGLPGEINGKPLYAASLSKGWL